MRGLHLTGSYEDKKRKLFEFEKKLLEDWLLNHHYNEFLNEICDSEGEQRVPYIGWNWRHIYFSEGRIPIGKSDDFVGFMANNKWCHPERYTTPEEFSEIMKIIDCAIEKYNFSNSTGTEAEIYQNTFEELEKLWNYLQKLEIPKA